MRRNPAIFFAVSALVFVFMITPITLAKDNATITGDGLRVRDLPNTKANILANLDKGTRVEVMYHTNSTDSIDGFTGYWYYIGYKSIFGYVFGKYISVDSGVFIPSETDAGTPRSGETGAAKLEDILGDWPMYADAPNIVFSFYSDGTAKFVESTFVGGGDRVATFDPVWGIYIFNGTTIKAKWDDGTESIFDVEKYRGVTTLTVDGQMLPPELHLLAPGETLEYD